MPLALARYCGAGDLGFCVYARLFLGVFSEWAVIKTWFCCHKSGRFA